MGRGGGGEFDHNPLDTHPCKLKVLKRMNKITSLARMHIKWEIMLIEISHKIRDILINFACFLSYTNSFKYYMSLFGN